MIKFILKILNKTKYLYYIGRHDILPPPLKGIEEKEALEKLGAGDNDARDLLIEHNLRLVVYVAKRYDTTQNGGIEDLISIGTIGLVKAINTFKPDKNIKLAEVQQNLRIKELLQICQIIWAGYLKKYVCSICGNCCLMGKHLWNLAILDDGGEQIHKREYRQKLI